MTALARLSCGQFESDRGITPDDLEQAALSGDWSRHLLPIDWALQQLPALRVNSERARAVGHGQTVPVAPARTDPLDPRLWRIYGPDDVFLALARPEPKDRLAPTRVFEIAEPSPYAPVATP